jgi:hypothetical protein
LVTEPNKPLGAQTCIKTQVHDQDANSKEQEMREMKRQQQRLQRWKGVRMKAQVSGPSEDPADTHQKSQKQVYNPIHTVAQQIEG